MAHHIDLAASFAAGFDFDRFRDDPRTVYACPKPRVDTGGKRSYCET
jgi:hypothetical protein